MSNETKRDVLEKLAECYAEVSDAYTCETGSPYYCDDEPNYLAEYDAALPDNLPTIPEGVGELIVAQKEYHRKLSDVLGSIYMLGVMRQQSSHHNLNWVSLHEEEFSLAWVLGVWRVEETGKVVKL
jgi:hypothetical protein